MEAETLEGLVRRLAERRGGGFLRVLREVYEEVERGELVLVDPDPPRSLARYLLRPAYSLWFWAATLLVAATLATIALTDALPWLLPLRYLLGSLFVLFIPGYALIEALYPEEGSLEPLERVALSLGLSLAVVPLLGLLLNYTPWGIRLEPVVTCMTLYSEAMLLLAAHRRFKLLLLELEARKAAEGTRRQSRSS